MTPNHERDKGTRCYVILVGTIMHIHHLQVRPIHATVADASAQLITRICECSWGIQGAPTQCPSYRNHDGEGSVAYESHCLSTRRCEHSSDHSLLRAPLRACSGHPSAVCHVHGVLRCTVGLPGKDMTSGSSAGDMTALACWLPFNSKGALLMHTLAVIVQSACNGTTFMGGECCGGHSGHGGTACRAHRGCSHHSHVRGRSQMRVLCSVIHGTACISRICDLTRRCEYCIEDGESRSLHATGMVTEVLRSAPSM